MFGSAYLEVLTTPNHFKHNLKILCL